MRTTRFAIAAGAVLLSGNPVRSEPVEDFYRGKTIVMYVGTGVGAGAVSAYPMALASVIKKYIPGNPNIVVEHMPGAGGIKAATYIEGIGPQDGTAWGFITRGFMLAPLLRLPQANFRPKQFNWIGSPSRTVSIGMVWNASTPVRSIDDAMHREVVVGATSIAQDTGIFLRALNRIIGTKFKIVTGYASVGAVDLAIERGELQGKVGSTWKSLNSGPSIRWVPDRIVSVLVQLGVRSRRRFPLAYRSDSISPGPRRIGRCSKCFAPRAPPAIPRSWARASPRSAWRLFGPPMRPP